MKIARRWYENMRNKRRSLSALSGIVICCLVSFSLLSAEQPLPEGNFKIVLSWSSFSAELEAVLLLPGNDPNVAEALPGSLPGTSSNQYVLASGDVSDDPEIGKEIFTVRKFSPGIYQLWIKSKFCEEGFDDADFFLSNDMASAFEGSEARVDIIRNDQKIQTVTITGDAKGLAWLALEIEGSTQNIIEINKTFPNLRAVYGSVIDAMNSNPVETALVIAKNRDTREIVGRTITDNEGKFTLPVDPGRYIIFIGKGAYISDKYEVDIIQDFPRTVHSVLSKIVPPKDYRIVLTWDRFPIDLDAHLKGPNPGQPDFHLYWNRATLINGKKYLDCDDRNSFGPETITIRDIDPGNYTYAVHNYSGRDEKSGDALSRGNVTVKIYNGDKLLKLYTLPVGTSGNYWVVFKLDGMTGQIEDVNQTGFISNPDSL